MSGQILKFDDSAHRAVDELLPWLVNGTLQSEELAAVEQHVRECARCRREIDQLQQLRAICAFDQPAPDPTPSYRRLQQRIAGRRRLASVGDRLRGLLRPWQRAPAWARWVIAVEFAGIVLLAAAVTLAAGESAGLYQTLGTPATRSAVGGTVAVVFTPATTEAELRRIVQAAGARVVDGPTESNAYVLAVPAARRDAALTSLRAEPAVVLAQPLAPPPDR